MFALPKKIYLKAWVMGARVILVVEMVLLQGYLHHKVFGVVMYHIHKFRIKVSDDSVKHVIF